MADDIGSYENKTIEIGPVTANPATSELVSAFGTSVLEPKVMSLLAALAEEPGRVWSREELLDDVWGSEPIGDENLTRAVYLLRKAFRDPHQQENVIKTVPKRGYQLRIASIEPSKITLESPVQDLSIAVLQFVNTGQNDDAEFLADGLCLDLTDLLARVPGIRVVPHSTAIRAPSGRECVEEICSTLNVRFCVTGSFQRQDRRIRIRVQLADTFENGIVWSKKYDAELDAFFELQDDIVLSISSMISNHISIAEFKKALEKRSFNPSVYELRQAAEAERWTYNQQAVRNICRYLNAALEIDPDNPLIHAGLTVQHAQNLVNGWAEFDFAETMRLAKHHLHKAHAAAPNHPETLASAGVFYVMSGQNEKSIPYLERSLKLNPNAAHVRALLGFQLCVVNNDHSGLDFIRLSERDAPYHPRYAMWASYRGISLFVLEDTPGALAAIEESIVRDPNYSNNYFFCATALVMENKMDEAKAKILEGLRFDPKKDRRAFLVFLNSPRCFVPENFDREILVTRIAEAWPENLNHA